MTADGLATKKKVLKKRVVRKPAVPVGDDAAAPVKSTAEAATPAAAAPAPHTVINPDSGEAASEAVAEPGAQTSSGLIVSLLSNATFAQLGLSGELQDACKAAGFERPTQIQRGAVPAALKGKDVIGISQTGSGKTAAYVLPVVQYLLRVHGRGGKKKKGDQPPDVVPGKQAGLTAIVLVPTRELATQVGATFDTLGAMVGLKTAVLVGGADHVAQAVALGRKPHVVVATPGRLKDHLENTKGFTLNTVRFVILDEADAMLQLDFGADIDAILSAVPPARTTLLFSATMSTRVDQLARVALRDPTVIDVAATFSTVSTLKQRYVFVAQPERHHALAAVVSHILASLSESADPAATRGGYGAPLDIQDALMTVPRREKHADEDRDSDDDSDDGAAAAAAAAALREAAASRAEADAPRGAARSKVLVFTEAAHVTQRVAIMLRALGISALPLYGALRQQKRDAVLERFRRGTVSVLVATDVAARGLDVPSVDAVVNAAIPVDPRDYVHRVGRTARAGRSGLAVSLISEFDVMALHKIEAKTGVKLEEFEYAVAPTLPDGRRGVAPLDAAVTLHRARVEAAWIDAQAQLKAQDRDALKRRETDRADSAWTRTGGRGSGDGIDMSDRARGLRRVREETIQAGIGRNTKRARH